MSTATFTELEAELEQRMQGQDKHWTNKHFASQLMQEKNNQVLVQGEFNSARGRFEGKTVVASTWFKFVNFEDEIVYQTKCAFDSNQSVLLKLAHKCIHQLDKGDLSGKLKDNPNFIKWYQRCMDEDEFKFLDCKPMYFRNELEEILPY